MKLTMLRGLPASGKSTYARETVKSTGNSGRINRDDLRAMLFDSVWSGKRESIIIDCEKAIAKVLFDGGINPIIDDTNLSEKHKQMWQEVVRSHDQKFESVDMGIDVATCIVRDGFRDKSVGRAVIDRMALQNGMIGWGDKPIILVDVDGTIANGDARVHLVKGDVKNWSAYFALMSDDLPVEWVIEKVRLAAVNHTICIVSGRPDTYQRETLAWLDKHGVPFDWIFMRPGSDSRPDTDIKSGFLKHLPKEKIVLVLDDRPSVCRMWEENGLNVEWVRGRDCEEF